MLFSRPVTACLAVGLLFQVLAPAPQASAQCQRAKLTADDGAGDDWFGHAVDICGQTAVIGAPNHDHLGNNYGAGYVFERSDGAWWQVVEIAPPGDGGLVGKSVAIDGDIIVLGATASWTSVFQRIDGLWTYMTRVRPDEYDPPIDFGIAVDVSGQTILVGDPEYDGYTANSGAAYVFERDPNGDWPQVQILEPTGGVGHGEFGHYLALDADVAVIGADSDDGQGTWSGAAYIFERDPNGVWAQTARLLAHDGGSMDFFGSAVAVSADIALVGAVYADGADENTGAAYVFQRDPGGRWSQTAKLWADDGASWDIFGTSVAISGELAVIGANQDDDLGERSGSAYVFVRGSDGIWRREAKLRPDDGAPEDRFGSATAVSGNTALIGAHKDDDNGEDSGSAYIFAVGPDEDGDGIMDVCLCPGDLDHDLDVDLSDLAQLLSNYGQTSGMTYEDGDLDEDGDVDLADLAALLAEYGTICP